MIADKTWNMLPDKGKAIMLAQREVASFVCDAVNLEGIPFTLPEIQTLLDGITVGGHRLEEQQIAVNQGNAWKHLFASLQSGSFILSAEYACKLHAIAAKEEALTWGAFRNGGVTIAGTSWEPPSYDTLPSRFADMVAAAGRMDDIYGRAIFVFLEMARNQFFYDVVTTHPYQHRAVPKRPFEWRPADCIPDLPWSAGNWRCGNRPRRAFLSGSTPTPSV